MLVYALEQDEIYEKFRKRNRHDTDFQPEEWKNSREELVRTVEQLLVIYGKHSNEENKKSIDLWLEPTVFCTSDTLKTVVFIIVDDNMFYRSMRRTLFNMARTRIPLCVFISKINTNKVTHRDSAGFAQVQVTCPIAECISRNASRANPVPENIIRDMAEKFEVPMPTSHEWERHTIQVSSHPQYLTSQIYIRLY